MAFTNNPMTFGNADILNPMVPYYAEQAAQHAARNPFDPSAAQQAQHWAQVLQQQRAEQARWPSRLLSKQRRSCLRKGPSEGRLLRACRRPQHSSQALALLWAQEPVRLIMVAWSEEYLPILGLSHVGRCRHQRGIPQLRHVHQRPDDRAERELQVKVQHVRDQGAMGEKKISSADLEPAC